MQVAVCVGLASQVYAPDKVTRKEAGLDVLELAAQDVDFVAVLPQHLADVSFTDADFPGGGVATVTQDGDAAAACLRHGGFETNDFCFEPCRFGASVTMRVAGWLSSAAASGPGWRKKPRGKPLQAETVTETATEPHKLRDDKQDQHECALLVDENEKRKRIFVRGGLGLERAVKAVLTAGMLAIGVFSPYFFLLLLFLLFSWRSFLAL